MPPNSETEAVNILMHYFNQLKLMQKKKTHHEQNIWILNRKKIQWCCDEPSWNLSKTKGKKCWSNADPIFIEILDIVCIMGFHTNFDFLRYFIRILLISTSEFLFLVFRSPLKCAPEAKSSFTSPSILVHLQITDHPSTTRKSKHTGFWHSLSEYCYPLNFFIRSPRISTVE